MPLNVRTLCRIVNVRKSLPEMFSCTQRAAQGKDFELILTVKIETRHPLRGPFSHEFLAFVIIAEL